MKCPHCKKELEILDRCYINVSTYTPNSAICRTECCGKGIVLQSTVQYHVSPYLGDKKTDSWGLDIK
jgi:hypothetical protein